MKRLISSPAMVALTLSISCCIASAQTVPVCPVDGIQPLENLHCYPAGKCDEFKAFSPGYLKCYKDVRACFKHQDTHNNAVYKHNAAVYQCREDQRAREEEERRAEWKAKQMEKDAKPDNQGSGSTEPNFDIMLKSAKSRANGATNKNIQQLRALTNATLTQMHSHVVKNRTEELARQRQIEQRRENERMAAIREMREQDRLNHERQMEAIQRQRQQMAQFQRMFTSIVSGLAAGRSGGRTSIPSYGYSNNCGPHACR